jgi:GNAT superfamily N-acetyltransferase
VHYHSWQAAVRGPVPDEVLARMSILDGELRWRSRLSDTSGRERTFIATDGEGPSGFCRLQLPSPDDDADAFTAQVASLYVLPTRWRRGLGSVLLSAALSTLDPESWKQVTLWSLRISERAQAFYQHHGFRPDGAVERNQQYGLNGLRMRRALVLDAGAGAGAPGAGAGAAATGAGPANAGATSDR